MSPHPPAEDRKILLLKLETVEPLIKCLEEKISRLEQDVMKATTLHPADPAEQALFLSREDVRPGEFTPSYSLIVADLKQAARSLGDEFLEQKKHADKAFWERRHALAGLKRQGAGPEALGPFVIEFLRATAASLRVGLRPALYLRERLLDQLTREQPRPERPRGTSEASNMFRRQGHDWNVRYANSPVFAVTADAGAAYIHYLLERPDRPVPVGDLDDYRTRLNMPGRRLLAAGEVEANRSGDDGPVQDDTTRRQIREEVDRIEDELEEAAKNYDTHRAAQLKADRQRLAQSLFSATRPGGKPVLLGDQLGKVTDRVRKAIGRTIESIRNKNTALGRHLKKAITTGAVCMYAPESPTPWEL